MDGWHKIGTSSEMLNVHRRTLYNWEKKGLIETKRTAGNTRLFNVNKYLIDNGLMISDKK
jgi:DNA-binding transcriptional MerR regulator